MSRVALNYLLKVKLYFINPSKEMYPLNMIHPDNFRVMSANYSSEAIVLAGEDVCVRVQVQIQVMRLSAHANMYCLAHVCVCGCVDGWVTRVPHPVWW